MTWDAPVSGDDFADVAYVGKYWLALLEREEAVGNTPVWSVPVSGDDIQGGGTDDPVTAGWYSLDYLMSRIETIYADFVDFSGLAGGTSFSGLTDIPTFGDWAGAGTAWEHFKDVAGITAWDRYADDDRIGLASRFEAVYLAFAAMTATKPATIWKGGTSNAVAQSSGQLYVLAGGSWANAKIGAEGGAAGDDDTATPLYGAYGTYANDGAWFYEAEVDLHKNLGHIADLWDGGDESVTCTIDWYAYTEALPDSDGAGNTYHVVYDNQGTGALQDQWYQWRSDPGVAPADETESTTYFGTVADPNPWCDDPSADYGNSTTHYEWLGFQCPNGDDDVQAVVRWSFTNF